MRRRPRTGTTTRDPGSTRSLCSGSTLYRYVPYNGTGRATAIEDRVGDTGENYRKAEGGRRTTDERSDERAFLICHPEFGLAHPTTQRSVAVVVPPV
jgi:hypothetical protein